MLIRLQRIFYATALSIIFLMPSMLYAAELSYPSQVELVAVNGEKPSSKDNILLKLGENQIAIKVAASFRHLGTLERFDSELVIIRFNAEDKAYLLNVANIRNKREADAFNKAPNVSITHLDAPIEIVVDTLTKQGVQWGRDYLQELHN